MKRVWQPAIPLRFVERNGQRILQQAWTLMGYGTDYQWHNVVGEDGLGVYQWRDVPMFTDGTQDPHPSYWSQEEAALKEAGL